VRIKVIQLLHARTTYQEGKGGEKEIERNPVFVFFIRKERKKETLPRELVRSLTCLHVSRMEGRMRGNSQARKSEIK